ncbi:MAG: hypothetical protein UW95_C0007G0009 [Parcubacteria group bacterium GW2011_GWC1_45_14]|nr:MAG: hypothetical protein UW95_C0007G0009 [Parcubacteria group bacterium GW2011_GWC1_45_14]
MSFRTCRARPLAGSGIQILNQVCPVEMLNQVQHDIYGVQDDNVEYEQY